MILRLESSKVVGVASRISAGCFGFIGYVVTARKRINLSIPRYCPSSLLRWLENVTHEVTRRDNEQIANPGESEQRLVAVYGVIGVLIDLEQICGCS